VPGRIIGGTRRLSDNVAVSDRLFVYRTLAPGRPNERALQNVPGSCEPAVVRGQLFEHGWGATMGFPALVLEGADVHGWLFSSVAHPGETRPR